MDITRTQFEEQYYIETQHGIFTPQYTYEEYIQNKDFYMGLEITKTAQEVYNEYLYNIENQILQAPTTEMRLDQQEQAIGILATQLAKNTLLQNGGTR